MPIDTAKLESVETLHSSVGLRGCVGSMDGVHFAWDNCPAPSAPAYKGKENYPTVVYNVTCDHARRVMSVYGSFPGVRNDKNIARTYHAVRAVRYNKMYFRFSCPMYDHKHSSHKSVTSGTQLITRHKLPRWPCNAIGG
jgi:hypothetical protein